MKQFPVFYAGAPESRRLIAASSAREAALQFFQQAMHSNSICVSSGWLGLGEKVYSWRDFSGEIPNLDPAALVPHGTKAPPDHPASERPGGSAMSEKASPEVRSFPEREEHPEQLPMYNEREEVRKFTPTLHIGMTLEEIIRVLGTPTHLSRGDSILGVFGDATISSNRRASLREKVYATWRRAGGEWKLVFVSGRMENIYSVPPPDNFEEVIERNELCKAETKPGMTLDQRRAINRRYGLTDPLF